MEAVHEEATAGATVAPSVDKCVILVGNFLSSVVGTRGVCEELASRLPAHGWKVITTSNKVSRPVRLLDMLWSVWRHRRDYAVAQVDVYSGRAFFWAEAVAWMLNWMEKPYVLTLHGGALPDFSRRWPRRVARMLRLASRVTTPSPYVLVELRRFRADIHRIANALQLDSYPFRMRENLKPHLVWLRAFHRIYNPELVPRVLALLAPDFPDIRISMIGPDKGDGSLLDMLQLARRLGVDDKMEIHGFVRKADVPNWISAGDIFVNTTNIDSAPVTILEAMACGLCVVSTEVGGVPYIIEHGCDGLLVPPNDPEEMAGAILKVLTNPVLARRLSEGGRQTVEQHDWSKVLPQWGRLFDEVLNLA